MDGEERVNRRSFLSHLGGLLLCLLSSTSAEAAKSVTFTKKALEGETIEALAQRSGYVLTVVHDARRGSYFVTEVIRIRGNKVLLRGPLFVPPENNPDAKPRKGEPCLVFDLKIGHRWVTHEESALAFRDVVLRAGQQVRFRQLGYNPRLGVS